MFMTNRRKRVGRFRGTAAIIMATIALATGGTGFATRSAAQESSPTPAPTPTPGVLTTPAANLDCSTVAGVATIYTVASEESEARYRVQEELAGRGAFEAVGATRAVIGNLYLGAKGEPRACSRFDVDLRTMRSDDARRDNYLYTNTLQTGTYPVATFVLSAVEGLSSPLGEQETTFRLIGNFTVHGVTKLVAWEITAARKGDAIVGRAVTVFEMPEFEITPPKVGPVVSLDETVKLEIDLVLKRTP